jgi:hypothetical protein
MINSSSMSGDTVSVDEDRADSLLRSEWNRVLNEDEEEYVGDYMIRQKLSEVLNASQLTYKYILVTNALAKAVNSNIHYRAMQAKSDLDGAYNARSLGHKVVVEWEKENGERLGGSNEPFLNKPARDPEFSMENAARSESAQERLYNLLERLQKKTETGEIDPIEVLRQTLNEISKLEPQTVEFESPSEVPFRELAGKVEEYLEETGGGERLSAVCAGVMRAYYFSGGGDGWTVDAEHANTPDEFSESAGDVEVFRDGELVQAIEVKDKPTERSDIQHAVTKARKNELGEYLYLVGSGFRSEEEKEGALQEIEEAPIEVVLLYPEDIVSVLGFVGDSGRVLFVEAVGEFLNDMRASDMNKEDWARIAEKLV